MSKLQGALKMFMLGMLKTILKTMLKYEKKIITLYGTCRNWAADFVFLLRFARVTEVRHIYDPYGQTDRNNNPERIKFIFLAELFLLFDWKYFGVEISRRTTCRRRADDLRMTCRWPADDTRVRLQARFGWRMTYVIRNVIRTLAWVAQFYAVLHLVSSTVKGTRLISQKVK